MSTTTLTTRWSTSSSRTHRYSKSGIGGAGNYRKSSDILPSPALPAITARTIGTFSTSIGGAGNYRDLQERPIVSSSSKAGREEAQRRAAAKNWYHGIGGAGNTTGIKDKKASSAGFDFGLGGGSNADKMRDGLLGVFWRASGAELVPESSIESLSLKD
ncbi:hypothetical protein EG329_002682 [Mollisiaceae sp. DMI_Dod_QoI]|nr:hypothetical protein EG329_002682 [Helotiales sp. DMI_Dod_QoI]